MLGALDPTLIIALGCTLTLAAMIGLVVSAVSSPAERRYKRRLREVAARKGGAVAASRVAARSLSRRETSTPIMDQLARWMPRRDILKLRLARTGRDITIGQFALATLVVLLVVGLAMKLFVGLAFGSSAMIGVFAAIALPHLAIGRMGDRRVTRFIALFPDAIDLMVRALRSGLPISEAIVNASQEIADPVGAEFRTVEAGMRLGRELEVLLWDIAKRIDAPEYKFFIIALSVQRETGGNLAEILDNLSYVIRERFKIQRQVRVYTAQGRLTMALLMGMPPIIVVVMLLLNPSFIRPLFSDPIGHTLLVLGITLQTIGYFVIRKIIRIQV